MTNQNLCEGCDLCCRKYKIYLFPKEAKKIAKQLNLNYRDFVSNNLDFYFDLFDVPTGFVAKEFVDVPEFIAKEFIAENKIVMMPILAIKQTNDACKFLKNKECSIYSARPIICQLFPKFKICDVEYDFCKIDAKGNTSETEREKYYPILSQYLKVVNKEGFAKTWKYLPEFTEHNIYVSYKGKKQEISEEFKNWLKEQI